MPIVSGNEPPTPRKKGRGIGLGWIWLLIVLARPIYEFVRSFLSTMGGGSLSSEQLLIIGGGLVALLILGAIVIRVNRMRESTTTSLPTTYQPQQTPASSPSGPPRSATAGQPFLPPTPRFEPIVTGKVFLAGVLLAGLIGGAGLFLLTR